jgi:hypothetical protein
VAGAGTSSGRAEAQAVKKRIAARKRGLTILDVIGMEGRSA